jgi:hypothetical protein
MTLLMAATTAGLTGVKAQDRTACTATADTLRLACGHEAEDDFLVAKAICLNEDSGERSACLAHAVRVRAEAIAECRAQHGARLLACRALGERRYDPEFEPAMFDADFRNPSHPNPYYPLRIGNAWHYEGGSEAVDVEVLNRTKRIDGVTCIVVRDLVYSDGRLTEATDDWLAQTRDGAVWYCGEEVKNYESFAGDRPRAPELTSIDGSFKVDRDGAEPGIIFLAAPRRGDVYREEFALGTAEDIAEVLTTTYGYGTDRDLDAFVPRALARLLCAGDCVVTRNYTPIEPGVTERKYYAPGIGLFLEVNPADGEVVQLVRCNVDPRCALLPRL